jgi:hypothetical protein
MSKIIDRVSHKGVFVNITYCRTIRTVSFTTVIKLVITAQASEKGGRLPTRMKPERKRKRSLRPVLPASMASSRCRPMKAKSGRPLTVYRQEFVCLVPLKLSAIAVKSLTLLKS